MNIQDLIITLLKEKGPLKAVDIAKLISQKYNLLTDRTEVNSLLYGKLKSQVYQDNAYRWSLRSHASSGQAAKVTEVQNTPLSRFASYYLECLSKDMDNGVWNYASSKFGSVEYGQLSTLPGLAEGTSLFPSEAILKTIQRVRQNKNRLTLYLGYPIYLRKVMTRTEFYVVEPIFFIPYDMASLENNGIPELTNELPRFKRQCEQPNMGGKCLSA
jgi:hypothetical protein